MSGKTIGIAIIIIIKILGLLGFLGYKLKQHQNRQINESQGQRVLERVPLDFETLRLTLDAKSTWQGQQEPTLRDRFDLSSPDAERKRYFDDFELPYPELSDEEYKEIEEMTPEEISREFKSYGYDTMITTAPVGGGTYKEK